MGLTDWVFSMPMFWVLCLIVAGGLIFAAVYYVRTSLIAQLAAPTRTRTHAQTHKREGKIFLFLLTFFVFRFTQLVSLTDLESDYQNPIDMCRNCNQVSGAQLHRLFADERACFSLRVQSGSCPRWRRRARSLCCCC